MIFARRRTLPPAGDCAQRRCYVDCSLGDVRIGTVGQEVFAYSQV